MGIRLALELGDTPEKSKVIVSGYERVPVTDEVCKGFGIRRLTLGKGYHGEIWAAANRYYGRVPNEAYLSEPVKGSSHVHSDKWMPFTDTGNKTEQVYCTKKAVSAKIISVSGKPDTIATTKHTNDWPIPTKAQVKRGVTNIKMDAVTLSNSITQEHTRTSELGWSMTVGSKIGVEAGGDAFGGKVSQELSIEFGAHGSTSKSTSNTVTREISRSTSVPIGPQQSGESSLIVGVGHIEIEVKYSITLSGNVMVWYDKPHCGHKAWLVDIKDIKTPALHKTIHTTELMKIGMVTDGEIYTTGL